MKLVLDFSGAVGGVWEGSFELVVGFWDLDFSWGLGSVAVAVAMAVEALLRAAMADSLSLFLSLSKSVCFVGVFTT